MKVAIGGGTPVELASIQDSPVAIAVDATSVYWVNIYEGTLMKVAIDGGTPVALASGLNNPNGVAVDATSIYWENSGDGTLMKMPLAGGTPTMLMWGSCHSGIAIDATNAYCAGAQIKKVALDGGEPVTLASTDNMADRIAVSGPTLYWTYISSSPCSGGVRSVSIDGGPVIDVVRSSCGPLGLAVDATAVYLADGGNLANTVTRVPIDGTAPVTIALQQFGADAVA